MCSTTNMPLKIFVRAKTNFTSRFVQRFAKSTLTCLSSSFLIRTRSRHYCKISIPEIPRFTSKTNILSSSSKSTSDLTSLPSFIQNEPILYSSFTNLLAYAYLTYQVFSRKLLLVLLLQKKSLSRKVSIRLIRGSFRKYSDNLENIISIGIVNTVTIASLASLPR